MQENVKVFTPEVLVEIFGDVKVKGDFTYKLRLDHINSRELAELANVNREYGMNFHVRRSGKGLIVYRPSINTISDEPKFRHKTVRDYYELVLSQDERIAAFDNTSKSKLDLHTSNIAQAILQSFYIADSPQGANYWQDIIWSHMYWDKD